MRLAPLMRLSRLSCVLCLGLTPMACDGCGDDSSGHDGTSTDDGTDSTSDSATVPAECTLELEAEPAAEVGTKEALLQFRASACGAIADAGALRDGAYFKATELKAGQYRRYVPLEEGENTVRGAIWLKNGAKLETESVTVTYTPGAPSTSASSGFIHGLVRAEGSEEPLAGAKVYVRDVAGEVETNAAGEFSFPTPGEGRFLVTIEAEGYTLAQAWVRLRQGQHASTRDVYLVETDPKTVKLTPAAGGSLVNSANDVTLEVPAGAVDQEVDVSAVSFGAYRSLPGALPDSSGWTQALELVPEGVRFDVPVTVRQENLNGFAPGFAVPVGYYNRDKGAWEPQGMATVTADGKWVEFETNHFSPYDLNLPVDPKDQGEGGQNSKDPCKKGSRGSSIIDDVSGQVSLFVPVSFFNEDNAGKTLSLHYNSGAAASEVDVVMPVAANGTDGLERLEARLELQGQVANVGADVTGTTGPYLVASRFAARNAAGEPLPTGVYAASVELTKRQRSTYMTANAFGAGGVADTGVSTREALPFITRTAVPVTVDNRADSPLGKGWALDVSESLRANDELGLAIWSKGDAEPRKIVTGLPNGAPVALPMIVDPYSLDQHAYDAQGRLYLLDRDASIVYRAPSREDVASAVALPAIDGVKYLVPAGDVMYALTEEMVLFRFEEDGTAKRLWNLSVQLTTASLLLDSDAVAMFQNQAGMVADKHGYLWAFGFGLSPAQQSDTLLPLLIRVDVSGKMPKFRFFELSSLTAFWQGPAVFSYDAVEHALYYVMLLHPVLRRFDIAGENEVFVTRDADLLLATSEATMVRAKGHSYLLDDERLLRYSPEGIKTVMAADVYEQDYAWDGAVRSIATLPSGEPSFVVHRQDGTGELTLANPDQGVDVASGLRLTRTTAGATLEAGSAVRTFDAAGRITTVTDDKGRQASFTYESDNLVAYDAPGGSRTTLAYAGGKVASITDPGGRTRALAYNGDGTLASITDPLGRVTSFTYDEAGHMTGRTSGAGSVTYTYDARGAVSDVTLDTGEHRQFTSLLAAAGPGGVTSSETAAATEIDGEGHVHRTEYNLGGQPVAYTLDGDEWRMQSEYVPTTGEQMVTVRRGGKEVLYTVRDSQGRTLLQELYDHAVVQADYEADGSFDQSRYYNQECSIYRTEESDWYQCADDGVNLYKDVDGRVIRAEDNDGWSFDIASDARGNTLSLTDAEGSETAYTRDSAGNLLSVTDPVGRVASYTYAADNELESLTNVAGGTYTSQLVRTATCDACAADGRPAVSAVTDPLGNTWTAELRGDGLIASLEDPLSRSVSFSYDGNRNLASVAVAGTSASFAYDGRNRVTSATVDSAAISYEYDDADNMVRAESPDFTVTRVYDATTDLVTETVTDAHTGHSRSLVITFDPSRGTTTGVVPGADTSWVLTHYGPGRLFLETEEKLVLDVDASSRGLNYATLRNDATGAIIIGRQYAYYDSRRRMESVSLTAGELDAYLTYSYATALDLPSTIESDAPALLDSVTYAYDAAYRPRSSHGVSFTYDAANRIATSSYAGTFVYDEASQLEATGLATYTYDAAGRRASRTTTATGEHRVYTFDALDRLVEMRTYATVSAPSPSTTTLLFYDPIGRLTRVETDGVSTSYQWLDQTLIGQYDTSGDLVRRFLPGLGADGTSGIVQDGQGFFAFVGDNGSVLRLVDEAGAVRAAYSYDLYGRTLSATGDLASQPRRFAGALWIEAVGLYYMRARFYDPEIGQFLSRDPIWKIDYEPYTYCGGHTLDCADPSGFDGSLGDFGGFAGGQVFDQGIKPAIGNASQAFGAAGTVMDMADAFSGYKPGDDVHNAKHGMRKIANKTFLDKNEQFREAMDLMDQWFDMFDDKDQDDGKDKKDKRDESDCP